jgi:hypothetical protein
MLIIGGRYLIFSSVYGMRIYWALGTTLVLTGIGGFIFSAPFYLVGFISRLIEILFSFIIIHSEKRYSKNKIE